MAAFPVLRTGAVAQYPAERQIVFSTQVVQFIDGAEQRFREFGQPLRRWVIRLELLDEGEFQAVRSFFDHAGPLASFSFTDPWDGTVYPECSIDGDELTGELVGPERFKTDLTIKENRT